MAEGQQGWEKQPKEEPSEDRSQPQAAQGANGNKEEGQAPDATLQQQQQQAASQHQEPALHVSLPFLTAFQNAQGHPGMSISPADLAALQQQQNLLFQHQVQQHYENEQRDKGAQGLMQGPDAMAMHALAAAQQHAGNEAHPPIHDMDFEKERKEKRKVANREAARRMRQRRSEQLGSLSANNDGLKVENQQLQHQIAQIATQNRDLVTENQQLKEELQALKQQLLAVKGSGNGDAAAGAPAIEA